jgi:hypothetical protein
VGGTSDGTALSAFCVCSTGWFWASATSEPAGRDPDLLDFIEEKAALLTCRALGDDKQCSFVPSLPMRTLYAPGLAWRAASALQTRSAVVRASSGSTAAYSLTSQVYPPGTVTDS